jgi:hypothetical protein
MVDEGAATGGTVTAIIAKRGDNFYRSTNAASIATFISGQSMNIAGNATTATTATTANATATGNNFQMNALGVGQANSTAGTIIATGDITAFSDIRVKKDIEVITGALSKVEAVRGVTFTRIDELHAGQRQTGVIAQELELVLPEAVRESENGMKTVNYGATVGLLIEAIKELSAQNKLLVARIEALESM